MWHPQKFLQAVQLILDSTFFIFDSQIYKQNFETSMNSLLSLRIILQDVLWICNFLISFYYKYMDDIVMVVPSSETNMVLEKFNLPQITPDCNLQLKSEKNKLNLHKINFLDITFRPCLYCLSQHLTCIAYWRYCIINITFYILTMNSEVHFFFTQYF